MSIVVGVAILAKFVTNSITILEGKHLEACSKVQKEAQPFLDKFSKYCSSNYHDPFATDISLYLPAIYG